MPAVLRGSLETFPLDLVLGLLEDAAVTGTLELAAGTARGELEVTAGRPTAARHGDAAGEEAIGAVISLDATTFEFTAGPTGGVELDLDMAGLRERVHARRAEDEALRRDIPSDRHTFVLSEHAASGAQLMVTAHHLRILRAIEAEGRDVAHIAAAVRLDRATTLRNLQELMREGIIEIRPPLDAQPKLPARPKKKKPGAAHRAAPSPHSVDLPTPKIDVPVPGSVAVEPSAPEPSIDDRLAALSMPRAPEPPAPEPPAPAAEPPRARPNILIGANEAPQRARPDLLIGANEPKPAADAPALVAPAAPEAPAEEEEPGARTSIFVSQYLPQGATIPLAVPKPPPPKRGILDLFAGFGKHRADTAPAGKDPLYSPRHVAVLVNALLFGYFGAEAADRGRGLREAIAEVEATRGLRVEPQLPISDGRIDAPALEKGGYASDAVVAVLHAVVRHLFDEDVKVQSGEHARRVFDAAVDQTLGSGATMRRDALRVVGEGPALHARLVIQRGGSGGPFELEERAYGIGRSSTNDIVLHDPSVSRQHARIFARGGRYVLADSGSTAGTKVEGQPVKGERVLRGGETIMLGEVALKLEMVDR